MHEPKGFAVESEVLVGLSAAPEANRPARSPYP
jgi:hypothetical protein